MKPLFVNSCLLFVESACARPHVGQSHPQVPKFNYVADSVVSQLLLLNAHDPHKDIKLFVTSTGWGLSAESMGYCDVLMIVGRTDQ